MAISALVQPIMGSVDSLLVDTLIGRLGGRRVDFETFDVAAAEQLERAGSHLLLHSFVVDADMLESRVVSVTCAGKSGMRKYRAKVFVDATGDGDVACAAGAGFSMGREHDGLMQPASIMFGISGVVEPNGLLCGCEEEACRLKIGRHTWHELVNTGRRNGELPDSVGVVRAYAAHRQGDRVINATQVNRINGTDICDLTRAELEGRKQAGQVLKFLQQHAPGCSNAYISAMPAAIGIREIRRFDGLYRLGREDVVSGRRHPDAIVRGASFPVDIHNPDGAGQAEGFAAKTRPYDIPLRCLIPEEIDGVVLSGRCISGSHEAHASYRVMCISMGTGAAAGAVAAIAAHRQIPVRNVDAESIQAALAQQGAMLADEPE